MNKSIIFEALKKILLFKVLFILLSAHLLFSPLLGNPVWGEKIILTQPNGIKIVGYIYGDEFHHRIETKEGYTIILNDQTGTIEYAILENNKLVPSGMVAGVVHASYLERISFPKHLTDRKFRIAEISQKSPEKFHTRLQKRLKKQGIKIQALKGTKKVFVVCVQFQAEASPPTESYSGTYSPGGFDERLFSTDPSDISMTNYYKSNSYDTFWPDGYTYPDWITLPQTASWYKVQDSWSQIITDAMDKIRNINPTFDFTQYANSGDMDMILVWAGGTENWADFYWPHMGLAWINRYGVRINDYFAVNEIGFDGSENSNVSVFCHEYGHMTGSPDLYDYSTFQHLPIGLYCLMGWDSYTTNFCGYLKWRVYGWITPEEVFSSGTYDLDALGLASASNPRLYKINIEPPKEFLLLENRHNGADPNYENRSGRRSGLLITHIDENYPPNGCLPDYTFYGVEAIVPGLDPSITTLEEYAAYYGEMVFASDHGYTQLGPANPDDQPAGAYLILTSWDDTENVIYRNTQGHIKSTEIYLDEISSSQETMSFSTTVPLMSPSISGSVMNTFLAGIAGVTLSFSDGGGETTTDTDGNYIQSVSTGWSGTVTPTKTGYIFDPSSRTYPNVVSSQIDQDYFASISFIKGNVTNSVGAAIGDVMVAVSFSAGGAPIAFDFTDSNGDYAVGGLNTGSYKLHFDTSYAPGMYATEYYDDKDSMDAADLVSVTEGSTTSSIDAVLADGGGIEGRVTNSAGAGIETVIVYTYTTTGSFVFSSLTDSNGNYEIKSVKSGSYKLNFFADYASGDYISEWYNDKDSLGTANLVSVTEGSTTSGVDTELAAITPIIYGAIKDSPGTGIAGVTLTFSNGGGTATTDSFGSYFLRVNDGWSGTATPAKAGYTFSPSSRDYANITSDQPDQYYTATLLTYTISGNVSLPVPGASSSRKTQAAEGLSGVVMDGLPGDPTTDASGNYSGTVDYGFSGTVTPTKAGYLFSPYSIDYANMTSDQPNQNYTASIIYHMLIIAAGTGGTTNPLPGIYDYGYGTQVQVTAVPDSGYQFSGWSGDASGTTTPITITMDADKSITANFILQYTLTIAAGSGGTTNPSPGSYTHDSGAQVSVTATANGGYTFSGWSGDASGTTTPITITMDSDKSITANFTASDSGGDGGSSSDSGGGKKCFIATAAYGSPIHPHLDILRDFRDKYLVRSRFGRKLVELYYRYSPFIAHFIARHRLLKVAVRINLLPLIIFSYSMVHFGPFATAFVLVFMLVFPILFIRFYPIRRFNKY